MDIDLLGGSYVQKYPEFNTERTINWYPVPKVGKEKDKKEIALFATAGLSSFVNAGGTNQRGIYTARTLTEERCFQVVDQTLNEVNTNGTVTGRGTLTNITNNATTIYLLNNATDLFIGHTSAAYRFTFSTNTLTQITDADYPGMEHAVYLNGYLLVVKSGRVYYSDVNDFSSWTASSVFTPTARADATKALGLIRDSVVCLGSESSEIYVNDSTPFSKLSQSTMTIGVHAIESVVSSNEGLFFLGRTSQGQTAVYFIDQNFKMHQISNFPITWALNNTSSDTTDAYGYIQNTKDGHSWYYLTVPALNTTYVYDISIQDWHERQSKIPSSTYAEFRGHHFTNFSGTNLFTDLHTAKILKEDWAVYTEDSQTIQRIRTSGVFNEGYQPISVYSVELDTNSLYNDTLPDNSPVIQLEYSIDSGNNWTVWGNMDLRVGASPGDIDHRTRAFKLGTGYNWALRLTLTNAIDVALLGAVAHGVVGSAE